MRAPTKLAILLGGALLAAQPSQAMEDCYAVEFDTHQFDAQMAALQKLNAMGWGDELRGRHWEPRLTFDVMHKRARGGVVYDGRVGRCVPQLPAYLPCGSD